MRGPNGSVFPLRYYWVARGILTWSAQVIDLGWLSLFQVTGNRSSVLGHVLMGLEGGLECSVLNTLLGWMSGALGSWSFIRVLRSSFGRKRGWVLERSTLSSQLIGIFMRWLWSRRKGAPCFGFVRMFAHIISVGQYMTSRSLSAILLQMK